LNKKVIILGVILVVLFMFVTPSIPAVQNQVVNNSFNKKIIEIIKNEDYKDLKGLLVQSIVDIEEPSDKVLHLRDLLDEIDKYSDDNMESKIRNPILHFLFSAIGVVLLIYGGYLMVMGNQGSYKIVGLISFLTGIIFVLLVI
jgi:hypothetical protein